MLYLIPQLIGGFIVALGYYFVILEERYHLKKSVAMIVSATVLWIFIGLSQILPKEELGDVFAHEFLGFCEIFFFITVAMTYVLSLEDFGFFQTLHQFFAKHRLSTRGLFWMTGLAAFCLSPFLDNLTTALLMGQILLSFAPKETGLIRLGLINLVLAANAGGVFSPFGDLTSLMIWQRGFVSTFSFRYLFIPALLSYIVPAVLLSLQLENKILTPQAQKDSSLHGCGAIAMLFVCTIAFTLLSEHFFGLPAVFGMLAGLGLIALYEHHHHGRLTTTLFSRLHRMDWDTLLFFYGIMLSIEGLKVLGVLAVLSDTLYHSIPNFFGLHSVLWASTMGHVLIGLLSALIDNIPMMAAVLKMNLELPLGSWLLLTLATGIGGSLLSIGSAAGIALMGLSKKHYTFQSHLKWTPIILLGYAVGISSHFWLNAGLF